MGILDARPRVADSGRAVGYDTGILAARWLRGDECPQAQAGHTITGAAQGPAAALGLRRWQPISR